MSPSQECKAASILYEGYSAKDVAFPIRVFARMGIKAVILTNAAGGINLNYSKAHWSPSAITSTCKAPTLSTGPNDERFGPRFPDMTHAYDREFREISSPKEGAIALHFTKASTRPCWSQATKPPPRYDSFRTIGADLVGMSTVPEVLAARHTGIRVLGISCVTNAAAGIPTAARPQGSSRDRERVKDQFIALLKSVIPRIAAEL